MWRCKYKKYIPTYKFLFLAPPLAVKSGSFELKPSICIAYWACSQFGPKFHFLLNELDCNMWIFEIGDKLGFISVNELERLCLVGRP
jgi:hypothetical protein